MKKEKEIALSSFCMDDKFGDYYQMIIREKVIPYQKNVLEDAVPGVEKSHAIENFKIAAGEKDGDFYGTVFQDSDVYKWLETAAYSLQCFPDSALEASADQLIRLIGNAQQPDGYLDTYYIISNQDRRWQNLHENHELYCAGHLIEAAVAYYEGTGKRELLDIACRLADHIDRRFGKDKVRGIPGHEEIELALMRLYQTTNERRYLQLAKYFLDERGRLPNYFEEESQNRGWSRYKPEKVDPINNQNHLPVREQSEAVGHSVRAMYLYTAMADVASETSDTELYQAACKLWENTVNEKMYITAGLGSTAHGEAFTSGYDLPNDTIYAETCASVGLVFFARKMLKADPKGEYADVMERALYNGVLSGMQHDGSKFFYVNPLEVIPDISGRLPGYTHVLPQRVSWYPCACCPPNLARLIMSLNKYAWGENADEKIIYSHLYLGGSLHSTLYDNLLIRTETDYPWNGKVNYVIDTRDTNQTCTFSLAVRIPGWCQEYRILLNGEPVNTEAIQGYCRINRTWKHGDQITLLLEMEAHLVYANALVRQDIGTAALMRGPICYCVEEIDNGKELYRLFLNSAPNIRAVRADGILGTYTALDFEAEQICTESPDLYSFQKPMFKPIHARAIPYYLWGNRGMGEMRVWLHKKYS